VALWLLSLAKRSSESLGRCSVAANRLRSPGGDDGSIEVMGICPAGCHKAPSVRENRRRRQTRDARRSSRGVFRAVFAYAAWRR
jgi:hypothetical protein